MFHPFCLSDFLVSFPRACLAVAPPITEASVSSTLCQVLEGNGAYRDNGRLLTTKELLQVANVQSDIDERLQALTRVPRKLLLASFRRDIALHIHTHCRTLTSGPTETPDNTTTVRECHDLTLVLADAFIDWVRVIKVISTCNFEGRARR